MLFAYITNQDTESLINISQTLDKKETSKFATHFQHFYYYEIYLLPIPTGNAIK